MGHYTANMHTLLFLLLLVISYGASCMGNSAHPGYSDEATSCSVRMDTLSVDSLRLQQQIDELASLSDSPSPSVTRVLYTEADVAARRYIKNLMDAAGLIVREDGVGNIFGRWEGIASAAPAIATGSHIDAIPFSGKYDGVVGVLGAIEAINALNSSGFKPKRSLEVIMFTSEEPTRFGISCLGSRLLAGLPTMKPLLEIAVDSENTSFSEAASVAGYEFSLETLLEVPLKEGMYSAFIELHIEQGPILEEEGIPIGIVTAIAAPASLKVDFKGNGGHAGAVLMPLRNDAGLAAAELALAVEKHVLATQSIDTVGTTGILDLHPRAVNSIPSAAHLEIDVRDIDEERRNSVIQNIKTSSSKIAERRGVFSKFEVVNQDPRGALVFNPVLRQAWVVSAFANTRAGGAAAAAARPVRWRGCGRKGGGSITIASGQVGAQEPLQNRGTPVPQDCRSSSSSCLTINRTILSGETVEHLGTIMVKGNVNSGAVICASGDIVILGQLEGEAHAGRSGDVHAIIFAWQLKSKTLSIAGCDAQGLASDRARFCEVALLSDGEIRIQDAADFSFKFASLQNEDSGKVQAGTLDSGDRPWFAINLKSMRKPSQVAFFTGAYIFVLGAALLLFPEPLFGVFFDLKSSVKEWIRVGAVLAMVFGVYYIGTACGDAKGCDGARSFYMSTVIGRTFIFFIFSWLVAIGAAPLPLFIVGAVNLIGAVTMLNALRRPKMS